MVVAASSVLLLVSCGNDETSTESDSTDSGSSGDIVTSAPPVESATTTTYPFPTAGTVPSSDIARLQTGSDVMKAAKVARVAWIPSHDPSCYSSDTELNAALDEFGRLPLYLGNLMSRAKALGDIDAYVAVNDDRKDVARWNPSQSVGLCSVITTTTSAAVAPLPKSNVDTNGARAVPLSTRGPFAVNVALTASDDSAACDGRAPYARFWLMRYDETLTEWVVEDFVRADDAATTAKLMPATSGEHRIEYFAYCGTKDIRFGVADVTVPGLDVTAGPRANTGTDSQTASVYAIVGNASPSVTVRGDATHVIVEPQAAVEWLDGSPTGTVTARINGGPWAVLSTRFASIVPVGTDRTGIEVDVVGAQGAKRITVNVVDTTSTTIETSTSVTSADEAPNDGSTGNALSVEESSGEQGDATIWVILGLVGLAASAVFLARLRLL
jgi:hypothetical protein